jgi:hypothetical protein
MIEAIVPAMLMKLTGPVIRWNARDAPVSASHRVRLRLPALTYWLFE